MEVCTCCTSHFRRHLEFNSYPGLHGPHKVHPAPAPWTVAAKVDQGVGENQRSHARRVAFTFSSFRNALQDLVRGFKKDCHSRFYTGDSGLYIHARGGGGVGGADSLTSYLITCLTMLCHFLLEVTLPSQSQDFFLCSSSRLKIRLRRSESECSLRFPYSNDWCLSFFPPSTLTPKVLREEGGCGGEPTSPGFVRFLRKVCPRFVVLYKCPGIFL